MNASTQLNNVTSNFRRAMNSALKSKAFALATWFAFWFAVGFVITMFFSLLLKGCTLLLGEVVGTIVYLILSFGLIYAIEAYSTRALRRR